MNEGGQSSTGQLIDFIITTHAAYPELEERAKQENKNIHQGMPSPTIVSEPLIARSYSSTRCPQKTLCGQRSRILYRTAKRRAFLS